MRNASATWYVIGLLIATTGGAGANQMRVKLEASSALPGAPAYLVADGNAATSWIAAEFSRDNWLRFELEEPVQIKELELIWQSGLGGCRHVVELSTDGVAWREIWRESENESMTGVAIAVTDPRPAAFIRIHFGAKRSQGLSGLRINGREIHDPSAPALPPIPDDAPYRDPTLPPEVRAADVVARMTDFEKMQMAGGYNNRYIRPLPRFGLREMFMVDASSGIRVQSRFMSAPPPGTISYPCSVALAATWNRELARRYGQSLARECRSLGIDILLGPGINLYRTSTCGRNFEYMGEDPLLAGTMASAYIQGMQDEHVLAVAKHFLCNNHEWRRHDTDVIVDERTLHELYMAPWYHVVRNGGVGAVMSSYNWLNGEKVGCSAVALNGLLRDRIGFDGLLMSDWGAAPCSDRVLAAGLDMSMAVMRDWTQFSRALTPDMKSRLDASVTRMLATLFRHGLYDRGKFTAEWAGARPIWEAVALETARESVTLLKNDGVLPLGEGSVLVLGPSANVTLHGGGGSGHVAGYDHAHIAPELRRLLGAERVTVVDDWANAGDEAIRSAATVVVCVEHKTREGVDFPPKLGGEQESLVERCVALNPRTIVVVCSGTGLEMDWNDRAAAVLWGYYPGQYGGRAIAEILAGEVNPSGRLPFSIEKRFADSPAFGYIPEGASWTQRRENPIDHALLEQPPVEYKEGVFIGYRWYDDRNLDVRYPFGHGMSYTTFVYDELNVAAGGEEIVVRARVRNAGDRAGAEVVQLYVGTPNASVKRPLRELKGGEKILLQPGEARTVEFHLAPSALAFYDVMERNWLVEPGVVTVAVGASSRDLRLNGTFEWNRALRYQRPTDIRPL
ncbi:MAG TPA: glycoside hydrolase family 3 C-terminal domain-containing protein [Kiritimatiellia bacterium]|nr:glycoside hydrolase family 3 C-terminal domain-containing protein [Kiritimatiellia bacterium]